VSLLVTILLMALAAVLALLPGGVLFALLPLCGSVLAGAWFLDRVCYGPLPADPDGESSAGEEPARQPARTRVAAGVRSARNAGGLGGLPARG
jgi:hypothetical protein